MSTIPFALIIVTSVSCLAGFVGIVLCRFASTAAHASLGRRLFMVVLLALGIASVLAASQRHASLPYLGLGFGGLVIGMVWEGSPHRRNWPWPSEN